jgi:hypothetical protein
MSVISRHFTPVAPTQFLRLRCPKDDGTTHLSMDIRLPVSITRLLELSKSIPNCFCGEAMVVGESAPTRPPGPVYRGDAPEGGADALVRMWPARGEPDTQERGGPGDR